MSVDTSASPSMGVADAVAPERRMRRFRSPETVIMRFVARRTVRSAAFWAIIFGAFVASKSAGYASAYPTLKDRLNLSATFGNNVGLSALFGVPHKIETVAGFTIWNTLSVMMIVGAIWAFLLATRTFRGEEDAGRWEMLLAGHTTARRATANALVGLGLSLSALYAVAAAAFILVGKIHAVDFGVQAALFFALAATSGAAMFVSIGALCSQLMPTRSRAASLAAGVFGLSFLLRAMASITSAHWLLNLSPLGWIDKLQPLYGSQPVWLVPIICLTLALSIVSIMLAGTRDLGASLISDHDSAPAHTSLLGSPFGAAVRLTRVTTLSWLATTTAFALFFGLLTKSATQAFSQSSGLQHRINGVISAPTFGAKTFLGVVFFLLMPLLMAFAASSIGHVREDEAQGYLDNFLVRPVSRLRWLWSRVMLIVLGIVVAGWLSGVGVWAGTASQHTDIGFGTLFTAASNIIAPALLTLGVGIFALGIVPRLTTVLAYSLIAWSFLIEIVSSGLHLNHWLLDTSVLHHVSLAPASNPNWHADAALAAIALALCLIGGLAFNRRDLANE